MFASFVLALAVLVPFEDIEGRFHVDLPANWHFAPQPGDTSGAVFRRQQDGVFCHAMVRVMDLPPDTTLTEFAARVRAASEDEPGYRSLARQACKVGGLPAECRRYLSLVNGNTKLAKLAEQRILVAGGKGYVVHAETLADGFAVFEPDVLALLASFAPGQGAHRQTQEASRGATWQDVLGTWSSRNGHTLVLSPGGTVVLDRQSGSYNIEAGNLICRLDDGMAVFSLDLGGGKLTLSGGMFGDGEAFTRTSKSATARPPAKSRPTGTKASKASRKGQQDAAAAPSLVSP